MKERETQQKRCKKHAKHDLILRSDSRRELDKLNPLIFLKLRSIVAGRDVANDFFAEPSTPRADPTFD